MFEPKDPQAGSRQMNGESDPVASGLSPSARFCRVERAMKSASWIDAGIGGQSCADLAVDTVEQRGSDPITVAARRAKSPNGSSTGSIVHPTSQYTNLNLLVSGLPVSVKRAHTKVRRDGYRLLSDV